MKKKLSIIIPVYNEEGTIRPILKKINELKIDNIDFEVIVINDGSTDNSVKIIKENNELYNQFINLEKNSGKGFAIKSGLKLVTGDYVILQDADLEYDPSEYTKLLNPIISNKADVVYGSRFLGNDERRVLYFWHTVGNKFLTLLSNMLSNLNLTDMEVCYKVFKTDVIKNINLQENKFGFEPEITAKIAKKNIKIYEVGIKYFGRKYSEGKKITWKDGFSAIRCIIKYNLFS
jgi:glycosyltransferase involved in cell wall biosynthesis